MIYVITWTVVLFASASAVAALVWALRGGQLEELERGASSIFDDDEGSGREASDRFPSRD